MGTENPIPILKTNNLTIGINKKVILSNINLSINQSEIHGIVGLSGSGKSVLIETLAGMRTQDSGTIQVLYNGNYIAISPMEKKSNSVFGISPQKNSFYNDMTILENLNYFGSLYKISVSALKQNIETVLNLVELNDYKNMFAGTLSPGLKRKLDFACALVHNPQILVLDSPTSDLDFMSKKQIWKLIRRINQKGKTIIFSSSSLDEVGIICDKITILHNQKVIFSGYVDNLRNYYTLQEEIQLITEDRDYKKIASLLKKIKTIPISDIIIERNKLIVYSSQAEKLIHFIIHIVDKLGKKITELDLNKPSLEEIFESICKNNNS